MILALALAGATVSAADKTPAAARAVILRHYDAIEHGRYARAYACWGDDGRASNQSLAAFVRGFARTRHVRAWAGKPGDSEGAAGSVYISVPVTVSATLKDGTAQRFRGSYVLRRVNDVRGATAAQLRWRIASAKLRRA